MDLQELRDLIIVILGITGIVMLFVALASADPVPKVLGTLAAGLLAGGLLRTLTVMWRRRCAVREQSRRDRNASNFYIM